ncbi:hypothetical protein HKD37_19G052635 [Glycine soja]
MKYGLASWARLAREETNDSLGELAACWASTSLADPLLGFPITLNELSSSLSGCHLLREYASLSETPTTRTFSSFSLKLKWFQH